MDAVVEAQMLPLWKNHCHCLLKMHILWEFPVVQWLELCASNAGGTDSVPGWGTKILHGAQCGQKQRRMVEVTVYSYCIVPEMLEV